MPPLALIALLLIQAGDWPTYRHDAQRTGAQPVARALSDPARVRHFAVRAVWRAPQGVSFTAAPIASGGIVYAGADNGRLYAFDAATLHLVWQYPSAEASALEQRWHCSNFPSNRGIAASPAMARIRGRDVVIVGAPDNALAPHFGSGRLFALDARRGTLIWASPALASLSDTTRGDTAAHEQIGSSSPLVLGARVYVGIGDACADHPVQRGRLEAVDLSTGTSSTGFHFAATGGRGGGIWSSAAADGQQIFVTTGNAHCYPPDPACPTAAPTPDYASSIVGLDARSGAVAWSVQPVPFALDSDADFGATPVVVHAHCGTLVSSVQKDGWAYAVGAGGVVQWQYPRAHLPFRPGDGTSHVGSTRTNYTLPAAAWIDELFMVSGGAGHGVLQAIDACGSDSTRLRWKVRVPHASTRWDALSAPSVTRGIVYIGVNDGAQGYVIAIGPDGGILADVPVRGGVRAEPVLAFGRVYVATRGGTLEMIR